MKNGIDISTYNRNIDYNNVDADFALIRVGYGVQRRNDQIDQLLDQHYNNLKGKMPLGAYYYAYANEIGEGRQEAENCLAYIEGKEFELPIYYDLEDKSMANIEQVAREFVDRIKEAGLRPGIYCNTNWARNKINLDNFQDCSIWIAQYGRNDGNIPNDEPFCNYEVWQYSSNGDVGGIDGRVDVNIASDEYINGYEPQPTPEPQEEYSYEEFVRDVQSSIGARVDGIAGPETLSKAPTISYKKNKHHPVVKYVQKYLMYLGYDLSNYGDDGDFGGETDRAVRDFQVDNGCVVDGEITNKCKTWKKLLNLA